LIRSSSLSKPLRRRLVLVVLPPVCAAAVIYALNGSVAKNHSAEAVTVVASTRTVTPDQANRLAITDAALIPKDEAVARAIARATGSSPREVQRRLTVTNDPETALLRIHYQGRTAAEARLGAIAVATSISGAHPESETISPRSIQIVQLPQSVSGSSALRTRLVLGIVFGVLVGAILAIASERADPRIDTAADLSAELECPVSLIDELSGPVAAALVAQWKRLASRSPATVALLPVEDALVPEIPFVAQSLALADPRDLSMAADGGDATRLPAGLGGIRVVGFDLTLIPSAVPGSRDAGEAQAAEADLTVLVMRAGTRRIELRRVVNVLADFDVTPSWALFVERRVPAPAQTPNLPEVTELPAARARG
jgi:capsular polysaccharide biosynthesis protein